MIFGVPIAVSLMISGLVGYMITIDFLPGLTALSQIAFSDLNTFVISADSAIHFHGPADAQGRQRARSLQFRAALRRSASRRRRRSGNLRLRHICGDFGLVDRHCGDDRFDQHSGNAEARLQPQDDCRFGRGRRKPGHSHPAEHILHSLLAGDEHVGSKAIHGGSFAGHPSGAAFRCLYRHPMRSGKTRRQFELRGLGRYSENQLANVRQSLDDSRRARGHLSGVFHADRGGRRRRDLCLDFRRASSRGN